MKFCTAVNCMEGRTQVPVIVYLMERFEADHIDIITEPKLSRIFAQGLGLGAIKPILKRIRLCAKRHGSVGIAVVGYYDLGNPAPVEQQRSYTLAAAQAIRDKFRDLPVIGLWVGEDWQVSEIRDSS